MLGISYDPFAPPPPTEKYQNFVPPPLISEYAPALEVPVLSSLVAIIWTRAGPTPSTALQVFGGFARGILILALGGVLVGGLGAVLNHNIICFYQG